MKIRVNGVDYDSWDDVPEAERKLLERVLPDTDHNGVPDAMEGKAEPGEHTYRAISVTTKRNWVTRVPPRGSRPAFRFQIPDDTVALVLPEPGELAARDPATTPATTQTPVENGPILLNGIPVGDDGRPLAKRRWWRRG